ncbi:MAG: dihydropteroate synthase [bacterium]
MRILSVEHESDLRQELARVGADESCWDIFVSKNRMLAFSIVGLSTAAANILKQTAIGCGGDCAVHRAVASGRVRRSDAVLFVSRRRLPELRRRLESQPECVARLAPCLLEQERAMLNPNRTIVIGGRRVDLATRTHVMGILNVTPDSFYDGGRWLDPERAVDQALQMEAEGADFVDIGGESTRPGSEPVPPAEQVRRVLPVLRRLRARLRVPVAIDTGSAAVARKALDEGAAIVNDVSGFAADPRLAKLVAKSGVPCVVMHLPAAPRTMQRRPRYRNLMAEVVASLEAAIARGTAAGVAREQLIVDPGLGFGKTTSHNLELVRRLRELESLDRPILLGPSRKRFIGELTGTEPEDRLEGTLAACVLGARHGANIVRVHDVKPVVRALRVHDALVGLAQGKEG